MTEWPSKTGAYGKPDYLCDYRGDGEECSVCTEDEGGCYHFTVEWAGDDGYHIHGTPDTCMIWQRHRGDNWRALAEDLGEAHDYENEARRMDSVCPSRAYAEARFQAHAKADRLRRNALRKLAAARKEEGK